MIRQKQLSLKVAISTLAVVALGCVPATVAAQDVDPTCIQYESTGTQITGDDGASAACAETLNLGEASTGAEGSSTSTPVAAAGPSDPGDPGASGLSGNVGPLPFTGFDVIAMAAVALAVTGMGLLLQRAVSRRPSDDTV